MLGTELSKLVLSAFCHSQLGQRPGYLLVSDSFGSLTAGYSNEVHTWFNKATV